MATRVRTEPVETPSIASLAPEFHARVLGSRLTRPAPAQRVNYCGLLLDPRRVLPGACRRSSPIRGGITVRSADGLTPQRHSPESVERVSRLTALHSHSGRRSSAPPRGRGHHGSADRDLAPKARQARTPFLARSSRATPLAVGPGTAVPVRSGLSSPLDIRGDPNLVRRASPRQDPRCTASLLRLGGRGTTSRSRRSSPTSSRPLPVSRSSSEP